LLQRFALTLFFLRKAVEGIECASFAVFEDDARAHHPVGALADDQVAHDIERTPGVSCVASASVFNAPFVAAHPDVGHAAQQSVQGRGSARENCEGFGEGEFRRCWHC
jgi:hypothetical protein